MWHPLGLCLQATGHLLEHVCGNLEVVVDDDPVEVVPVLVLDQVALLHQVLQIRFLGRGARGE